MSTRRRRLLGINHVALEVGELDYRDIQFTKAPAVIRGMGLEHLQKRGPVIQDLRTKGLT